MFELVNAPPQQAAVIKVIGVGGGGCNAVDHMYDSAMDGVEFVCVNTDVQALQNSRAQLKLHIGSNITKGLGAGTNPDIGRKAAIEDRDSLVGAMEGADMVFITAGMGGGTGTGAAPVIAEIAKEMGILTVAVVTRPFAFEGGKRERVATHGIKELGQYVDSLIIIPNQRLLSVLDHDISLIDAFRTANDVLLHAVQGIAELITSPGLINVDFADVRTVMGEMGMAMMGAGRASGEERARKAAESAMSSPLLEEVNLAGAKGMLVNVSSGPGMSLREFEEVGNAIKEYSSDNATIVIGTAMDPSMENEVRVTVVATGIAHAMVAEPEPLPKPALRTVVPGENDGGKRLDDGEIAPDPRGDYHAYDKPTMLRRQGMVASEPQNRVRENPYLDPEQNEKMLDIPAFLRRKAD
ncbi:MAG: cell division protein FtsZ [Candidatus Porifericomitaceae bacterium WSBS_2022_MAG_OTU9]